MSNKRYIVSKKDFLAVTIRLQSDISDMNKQGLQIIVEHLEKGAILLRQPRDILIKNLQKLIDSSDPKVRRWVAITTAHLKSSEIALMLKSRLSQEKNEENQLWFQAACAACGVSDKLDRQALGFAAALGADVSLMKKMIESAIVSDPLSQRGLGIALGYSHVRKSLKIDSNQLSSYVEVLMDSSDYGAQEYAAWVQTRLLESGCSKIKVLPLKNLYKLPPNVKRWHARLLGQQLKFGHLKKSSGKTIIELGAKDQVPEVREGFALGIVGWCPSVELSYNIISWYVDEPDYMVRLALLQHMAQCSLSNYKHALEQELFFGDASNLVNDANSSVSIKFGESISSNQQDSQSDIIKILGTMEGPEYKPDIALITALPIEYSAVKTLLEHEAFKTDLVTIKERRYLYFEIDTDNGSCNIVLPSPSGMGNNLSAVRTTEVVNDYPSIKFVILCGIAGGVSDHHDIERDVRLGDVVVSNGKGVIQFDHHKNESILTNSDEIEVDKITPRFPPRPPSAYLLKAAEEIWRCEMYENKREWSQVLKSSKFSPWASRPESNIGANGKKISYPATRKDFEKGIPKLFLSPIGSGNLLLRNPKIRDELGRKYKILAVEMEGSGLADAAWERGIPGYLIVRGIQDYCDLNKGDTWRGYASASAAAATIAIIKEVC